MDASRLKKLLCTPAAVFFFALLILVADFFSGPRIRFPVVYIAPVALAAWFCERRHGLVLAVGMPVARFLFHFFWPGQADSAGYAAVNMLIQIAILACAAALIARHQALERRVQTLEGMLPVCSFCKKIRNEEGSWQQMESYISGHSEARFTHTFCPQCMEQHYGSLAVRQDGPGRWSG